jgi:hypothetical protein
MRHSVIQELKKLPSRPNRKAKGALYTEKRRELTTNKKRISNPKHPDYNETKDRTALKLMCFGTCDTLAKLINYSVKKIKKEHPTDKGYFKECYVLTDSGRTKLKRMKKTL